MNSDPHHVRVSHVLQCVFVQLIHAGKEMVHGIDVGGGRGFRLTVSCVPIVLNRRYTRPASRTSSNL